jgi:polar amino acid transport system substrate-binding protein
LYAGTPTSVLIDPAGGERKGVGFELGRALAQQLGVPYEAVVLPNNAAVLAALIQGEVDVVFTNASPERAAQMRFTQPYLDIELGLLVPAGSTLRSVTDIDRPGQTLGVTAKSSSDAYWSHQLHSAGLQRAATLQQGSEWLAQGQIQAYATNKATLFEMAETLPGARVLPDRWGLERHAIGIAPAREDGLGFLQRFADEQKAAGMIQRAAARAGLRGVAQ